MVIIINGGLCVPTGWMKVIAPVIKATGKNFKKWAETVPYTLRNPLYHWTHLELQRYF
ncbi:MAG: glucuronate isomerase [Bacteroidota bacterium]